VTPPGETTVTTRSRAAGFAGQLGWSLGAKLWYAALQLVVLVLLARDLGPGAFGWVASVNVVMAAVTATNGFGLMRQIQYRRSVDPHDPTLGGLFDLRLWFTYGSAAAWVVACVVLLVVTGDGRFAAVLPIALWLALDQTIAVWNAISIVDGRTRDLVPSYTARRLPVIPMLLVADALGWDTVWTWSIGLTLGTVVGFVEGRRRQEPWARHLWPHGREPGSDRLPLDLGYWWAEVGAQVRDLDVTAVAMVGAGVGGIYALPARLVKPMNMITLAASSVAFPRLARRPYITMRQVLLGSLAGTAPVTLIAIVAVVAAPLLPVVVGHQYDAAVAPFRILCLAAVLTGWIAVFAILLQSRANDSATRVAGYLLLGFGLLQVVAAWAGARLDGAVGASWAAVIAQAALVGALWLAVVRQCRLEAETAGAAGTVDA
jgi:O-antigen/teichoic acid export membrane protein